jgi:hypothetical protein
MFDSVERGETKISVFFCRTTKNCLFAKMLQKNGWMEFLGRDQPETRSVHFFSV